MAGIYIHIPFCKQACHYCNFHFSTSLRYKNEFLSALLKEIGSFPLNTAIRPTETPVSEPIETIYFGGGTPSLFTKEEIKAILSTIKTVFTVDPGAEVTLEANPDDIDQENLLSWKYAGINRLSIGVQSFFEEDLLWMNRAHSAHQAIDSLKEAIKHFSNITIDLIYGTPSLTNERWKENVERAISFGIPHLSCYALTVEPKTPLDKLIREHKSSDVDPGKQSEQFLLLMKWMERARYEHYEISNFAKPGFRSRHNSSYWQGKPYYGFGPSAHSFYGITRWWNIANNNKYIGLINKGMPAFEKEELTPVQQMNEYIMISLRTSEGLPLSTIPVKDAATLEIVTKQLTAKSNRYIEQGLMKKEGDHLILTKEGKLLADGIAADLFIDQGPSA